MLQIHEPHNTTFKLLGEPKIDAKKEYRPLRYLVNYEVEKGLLIYNVLTGELILLEDNERASYEFDRDTNNFVVQELIKKWFLVSEDTDEIAISKQVRTLLSGFFFSNTNPIVRYTIFPTTDCNARCFYCFERDRTHKHMTPKTASDVADFIITKSKGQPVHISWFGGEPLYNSQAIDIISKKVVDAGIELKSHATSNGYLFSKDMVNHAIDIWHLKTVQITLDGTEEIYNRCKNFIYKEGSAFKVVTKNIEYLLDAGIEVSIRMNMDEHNIDDLYKLTDFICEKYGGYKNLKAYAHLLFEDSGKKQIERTDAERHALTETYFDFNQYLLSKLPRKRRTVRNLIQYHQCMADDPASTTILPDGKLGKCEHYSDTDFWGSIYDDNIDQSVINDFRRVKYLGEKCDMCPLKPLCNELVRCAQTVLRCDEVDFKYRMINIEHTILTTYNEYLTKEANTTNTNNEEIEISGKC